MTNFDAVLISVVVVSWNTLDLLRDCLESIRYQLSEFPERSVEIIVVDNNSSDGSALMVQSAFPEVRLLQNKDNRGFAGGTNQGAQLANGSYVLLLNPDTRLYPGSLRSLVDFMEGNREAGAAGAKLVNPDGTLQVSAYPSLTLFREFWRLFHLDQLHRLATYPLIAWNPQIAHPVEVVQGACMMIRHEAIEDVGLLDEEYFMYTEEVDLCHRLRQAGWGVYWVPKAEVLHHGGQSTRQRKLEMFLQLYASKIQFFRKHHGPTITAAYKVVLALASLPRLSLIPLNWIAHLLKPDVDEQFSKRYFRLLFSLPSM